MINPWSFWVRLMCFIDWCVFVFFVVLGLSELIRSDTELQAQWLAFSLLPEHFISMVTGCGWQTMEHITKSHRVSLYFSGSHPHMQFRHGPKVRGFGFLSWCLHSQCVRLKTILRVQMYAGDWPLTNKGSAVSLFVNWTVLRYIKCANLERAYILCLWILLVIYTLLIFQPFFVP